MLVRLLRTFKLFSSNLLDNCEGIVSTTGLVIVTLYICSTDSNCALVLPPSFLGILLCRVGGLKSKFSTVDNETVSGKSHHFLKSLPLQWYYELVFYCFIVDFLGL